MTRRNARNTRRFQLESLEDRNAPSHFAAHAIVAHAATHSVHTVRHQEVRSLDLNTTSAADSSKDTTPDTTKDTTNDSSTDTTSGSSKDTTPDPSKDVSPKS